MDPDAKAPPLAAALGIKLTVQARQAVREAAASSGLSDCAWIRRLVLRELNLDSPDDHASGPRVRVPTPLQADLSAALRAIQHADNALAFTPPRVQEAQTGLGRARGLLVDALVGRRP